MLDQGCAHVLNLPQRVVHKYGEPGIELGRITSHCRVPLVAGETDAVAKGMKALAGPRERNRCTRDEPIGSRRASERRLVPSPEPIRRHFMGPRRDGTGNAFQGLPSRV